MNIKNLNRDDIRAPHRVPPQIIGGLGDLDKVAIGTE